MLFIGHAYASVAGVAFHCIISWVSCTTYFIRVDAGTDIVYELIAEPIQEPQAGEPRAEAAVEPAPEVANPAD